MIVIKSNRLFFLLGVFLLICIPFLTLTVFDPMKPGDVGIASEPHLVVLIIMVELFLYFFFALISGVIENPGRLILYTIVMSSIRILSCLVASSFFAAFSPAGQYHVFLAFWVGNPILVLVQVLVVMLFGPHLLLSVWPGLMGEKAGLALRDIEPPPKVEPPVTLQTGGEPLGGFVRVYHFPELGRLLSNIIGLEGYILYTWEGLILWHDCQLRFDAENLVVHFQQEWNHQRKSQSHVGFNEPERIITQTIEHNFIHVRFGSSAATESEREWVESDETPVGFFGIFIFRREVDMGTTLSRLKYLERSAKELLEMRYSSAPGG